MIENEELKAAVYDTDSTTPLIKSLEVGQDARVGYALIAIATVLQQIDMTLGQIVAQLKDK